MTRAVRLNERAILELGGDDCRTFLQDLVSNDIETLTSTHAIYAALLSPQGKYLFDFFLTQIEDRILLDVDAERIADLTKRLMMYRLRADVTIEDRTEGWAVAALLDAPDFLAPGNAGDCAGWGNGVVFIDPRSPNLGARAIVPKDKWPGFLAELNLEETSITHYEKKRISCGIPDGRRDLIPDKTFLMEAHFEALNGVDFHKGCYVGQELTARTKYRGNLKRHFYALKFDGPALPADTPVLIDGKEAGVVRSSLDGAAIGYLRDEDVAKAHESGQSLMAGDTKVEAREPDFV